MNNDEIRPDTLVLQQTPPPGFMLQAVDISPHLGTAWNLAAALHVAGHKKIDFFFIGVALICFADTCRLKPDKEMLTRMFGHHISPIYDAAMQFTAMTQADLLKQHGGVRQ